MKSKKVTNRSAAHGFTMIEMMITLVVVAIIVAIGAPSFQSMTANAKAEKASGMLLLDIKLARSHSVSRGENVQIKQINDNLANGWEIKATTTNDTIKKRETVLKGVTYSTSGFSGGSPEFTPTGQASGAGAGSITIKTTGCTGNENKKIEILTSGQIAIEDLACE
jgi:type IV fimbrial biogenesis protein FimT